jgi:hypothetical protein
MRLYAGAYTDKYSLSNTADWGRVIEKTFYIRISNANTTSLDLISPCPGDLRKNVDSALNKDFYFY